MKAISGSKSFKVLKFELVKFGFLFILYLILAGLCVNLYAQTFTRTWGTSDDLSAAVGSCATPGVEDVSWYRLNVSGVGVLNSTTKALTAITIKLDNSCDAGSVSMRLIQLRVMSPTGTCAGVYYGDNAGAGADASINLSGTQTLTLITPQSCTNYPNSVNTGNGNVQGVFGAKFGNGTTDTPTNLQTTFNGVNADGDWKFIFSEGTASEPCLKSIALTFGDESIYNAFDATALGETCASAISMCRKAACLSTNGKNNEANSPGAEQVNDVNTTVFNNGNCAWNNANNNDTWVKFQAASTSVTISVSSLDYQLQSIVVTNPTGNGSVCPAFGTGWNYVSCPRDAVYGSIQGATMNHNHTFATTVGQVYYLVVDGTGGIESPFYINIADGTTCTPLPIIIGIMEAKNLCSENVISWTTLSERNNNYFIIEEKVDDSDFIEVGRIRGAGNSSSEISYEFIRSLQELSKLYYYRITQVDYDGKKESFNLIAVKNDCNKENIFYSNNKILTIGFDHVENIIIFDMLGRKLIETSETSIDFNSFASAFYNVVVTSKNGNQTSNKIYKP